MKSFNQYQKDFFQKYNKVCQRFFLKLCEYNGTLAPIQSYRLYNDEKFREVLKEINEEYKNANYGKTGIRKWDMWYSTERWDGIFRNLVKNGYLIEKKGAYDLFEVNLEKLDEMKNADVVK